MCKLQVAGLKMNYPQAVKDGTNVTNSQVLPHPVDNSGVIALDLGVRASDVETLLVHKLIHAQRTKLTT